jgi:hypothetical protein
MRFSREPVVLVQGLIIPILLAVVMLFRWPADTVGVVDAALLAVGGVVAALGVSVDATLPLLGGLAKALLAVLLQFGVHVSEEWQTTILVVVSIAVAYVTRPQVTAKVQANYALAS